MGQNYPCCCGEDCCIFDDSEVCEPCVELYFANVVNRSCVDCDLFTSARIYKLAFSGFDTNTNECKWVGVVCPGRLVNSVTQDWEIDYTCHSYKAILTVEHIAPTSFYIELNLWSFEGDELTQLWTVFSKTVTGSSTIALDTLISLDFYKEYEADDAKCDFTSATAKVNFKDLSSCIVSTCTPSLAYCNACCTGGSPEEIQVTIPSGHWTNLPPSSFCGIDCPTDLVGAFVLSDVFPTVPGEWLECKWRYLAYTCGPPFYAEIYVFLSILCNTSSPDDKTITVKVGYDGGFSVIWQKAITLSDCSTLNESVPYHSQAFSACSWDGTAVTVEAI